MYQVRCSGSPVPFCTDENLRDQPHLNWRACDDHLDVEVPKAAIRRAIAELEAGKAKKLNSVDALMADLNADD